MFATAPFSRSGGLHAAPQLLTGGTRPTALFVGADLQGVGALHACRELGLWVPRDVALVATDGTQEAEFTKAPMTMIQQQPSTRIVDAAIGMVNRQPATRSTTWCSSTS